MSVKTLTDRTERHNRLSRTGLRIGRHVEGGKMLMNGLAEILDAPATAMQLFAGNPHRYWGSQTSDADRDAFIAASDGIFKIVHANYLTNIGLPPEDRGGKMTRHSLVNLLEWCDRHAIDQLVFHPGSAKDESKEQALEWAEDALREVLIRYEGNVGLCLENAAGDREFKLHVPGSSGRRIGSRITELSDLIGRIGDPRLGIVVDTTHAFAAGYSVPQIIETLQTPKVSSLLRCLHFNTPDPHVKCGSYADRHSVTFDEGAFTLKDIQDLFLAFRHLPLIMEGTPGIHGLRSDLTWLLSWELELQKHGTVSPPKVLKTHHEDDIFNLNEDM